jgi:hypothetical protein
MKRLEKFLLGIIIGGALMFLLSTLTSCKAGYGCHGTQSWKKMERRINRPY